MIAANGLLREGAVSPALPFHVNALLVTVLAPLFRGLGSSGRAPGLPRPGALRNFWKVVERYGVTTMSAVPTVYSVLADAPSTPTSAAPLRRRRRLATAAGGPGRLRVRHRHPAGRGLRPDRGHLRQRTELSHHPRPGSVGQRLPYQQVKAVQVNADGDGPTCRPVRSGCSPSAGRPCFPATSQAVPRRARAGRAGQAARRLAGHRGPGLGRRRRLRPPRRPSQGPDHPRRSQHRPGGHRERAAGPPGGRPRRRWVVRTCTPGRCRWRSSRSPRRHRDPEEPACLGLRPRARAGGSPQTVTVLDALPVTLVGKPFKPALRAEATREAVADALRDIPAVTGVRAAVEDGAVVAVVGLARGADETSVRKPSTVSPSPGDWNCHDHHLDSRASSSSRSRPSARPSSPPCPPCARRPNTSASASRRTDGSASWRSSPSSASRRRVRPGDRALAAAGLLCSSGAIVAHLRNGDGIRAIAPAVVLGLVTSASCSSWSETCDEPIAAHERRPDPRRHRGPSASPPPPCSGSTASTASSWTAGTASTPSHGPHLDDEIYRVLVRLGIAEQFAAVSRSTRGLQLIDRNHRVFAAFDRAGDRGRHGHPQANMFDQPELEHLMRTNLKDQTTVSLRGTSRSPTSPRTARAGSGWTSPTGSPASTSPCWPRTCWAATEPTASSARRSARRWRT